MRQIIKNLAFAACFLAFIGAAPAFAQANTRDATPRTLSHGGEPYVEVNIRDLANASLLVGAMTLNEQPVLDEYAQLFYCHIYNDFFQNDSEWLEVSDAIRKQYNSKKNETPLRYFFKTEIMIGRYDADTKSFPLVAESAFKKVSYLDFYTQGRLDVCGLNAPDYFPHYYSLFINSPLTLDSLPITSQAMLQKVSEIPIWEKSNKRITGVFFITLHGYKDRILTGLKSHVIFSGSLDRVSFYTDDTLENHIRSIDYQSLSLPPPKQYEIPEFQPEQAPAKK